MSKTLKKLILSMLGYVDATNPTDAAVLAWLNESVTVQNDATNGDVLAWAASNDGIAVLETHSAGTDAIKRGLADAALARVRAGLGLNTSQASIQTLLASLVATGMFNQVQVDALNATAQVTQERWQSSDIDWVVGASETARRTADIARVRI